MTSHFRCFLPSQAMLEAEIKGAGFTAQIEDVTHRIRTLRKSIFAVVILIL